MHVRQTEAREPAIVRPPSRVLVLDDDPALGGVLAEALQLRLGGGSVVRAAIPGDANGAEARASEGGRKGSSRLAN